MEIFNLLKNDDFEQVTFFTDKKTGLKAIIAIHNTLLGPALGGCRMYNYKTEEDALKDVLNLAKGMTYKAAAVGLALGGGKSVIIGDPKSDKNEALLKAFAKCVESLEGKYIVSKDVGTSVLDLHIFKKVTNHVSGLVVDPSVYTAYGVVKGIKAAYNFKYGMTDLRNVRVAIQGLGAVGYGVAKLLFKEGCHLTVSDPNENTLLLAQKEFNAKIVKIDEIYNVDCDIWVPCALGQVINETSLKLIKAKIIAGSANNQLIDDTIIKKITELNILYVPDYVINAGGLIAVAVELKTFDEVKIYQECDAIYERITDILETADRQNISTLEAANLLVTQKILLNNKNNLAELNYE